MINRPNLRLCHSTWSFATILILLVCTKSFGQKQANIWYFGDKAGLDFNHTPPKALLNSEMKSYNGSASIADVHGQLLFYTNGSTVYDKRHEIMENGTGLYGYGSSGAYRDSNTWGQSAVIVPRPGFINRYYIFTVGGRGAHYSEVDLSRNNGNGSIVSKNQPLISRMGYRFRTIGATSHSNRRDYWVCYLDKDSVIKSFLVNSQGVQHNPVISTLNDLLYRALTTSYMKFTSDNRLVAYHLWTYHGSNRGVNLHHFDDKTGKFSKGFRLKLWSSFGGLEFSPNSNYLYIGSFQYDVSTFDSQLVMQSGKNIFHDYWRHRGHPYATATNSSTKQLGPDGKIYFTFNCGSCTRISYLANPNERVPDCGSLYADTINLTRYAWRNFPTFLQTYINPFFYVKGTCLGDTAWFMVSETEGLDSLTWHFGDSTSITRTALDTIIQGHVYKKAGIYDIKTIYHFKDNSDTAINNVVIRDYLATGNFLGDDLDKCRGDSLQLNVDHWTFERYQWSTGDTSKNIVVDSPGLYWIRLFPENKCFYTDTIRITDYPNDEIPDGLHLAEDLNKCSYDTIDLIPQESFKRYRWSTGDTTAYVQTTDSGTFVLTGYNHNRCFSKDTIHIGWFPDAHPNLGPDSNYCSSVVTRVRVGDLNVPFDTYFWNTGSNDPFIHTDTSGEYVLKVSNEFGCVGLDTVQVSFVSRAPEIRLGDNRQFCDSLPQDSFLTVENTGGKASYGWHDHSTDSSRLFDGTGLYKVYAWNGCGITSDSVFIRLLKKPEVSFESSLDSIFCDTVLFTLKPNVQGDSLGYYWNTGDSTPNLFVDEPGVYQVNAFNLCGIDSARMQLQLVRTPLTNDIPDTALCTPLNHMIGVQLDSFSTIRWYHNGLNIADSDSVSITSSGVYTYHIENYCGAYRDTLNVREIDIPSVQLGPDIDSCDSLSVVLQVGDSTNNENYQWSTSHTSSTINITQPGTYWVRASNTCGTDMDTITIRLHHTAKPLLPRDTILCDKKSLWLDASIPGNHNAYEWNTGDSAASIEVRTDGLYSVLIRNYCQSLHAHSTVRFRSSPRSSLPQILTFCDSITPTEIKVGQKNNDEVYLWSTGDTSHSVAIDEIQSYWVKISNGCGSIIDSTRVKISKSPIVSLDKDTALCGKFQYELDAGNPGMHYLWHPTGERSQIIYANKQQKYHVEVTNEDGCTATDFIEFTRDCISSFYVPTAFSPNNDGLNDVFRPRYVQNVDQYQMEIFNRWGERLFSNTDTGTGWDGTYQGIDCPMGTYTVLIHYYDYEKRRFERYQTRVVLLR